MGLIVRYYGSADLIHEKGMGAVLNAVWRIQSVERAPMPGEILSIKEAVYSGVVSLVVWDGDTPTIYRSVETIKGFVATKEWEKHVSEEIMKAFKEAKKPEGLNDYAWANSVPRVEHGIYMDAGEIDVF